MFNKYSHLFTANIIMEKENPKKSLDYYHIHFLLLHEFKLGNKADQAVANINRAWGPGTTSRTTAYDWYEKFARGDTSLEEKEGRGHKSKLSDEALKEVVEANPRTTLCALATLFEVDKSTISRHLAAIGKVRKLEKWIPHELTENQKLRRFEVASSLLLRNKTEPFLNRIITCDEKWILYNNRKRSGQWVNKGEPAGHFPNQDLYPKKRMVTVWWSAAGLIQYSFLQPGETITAESYSAQLAVCHQKLAKSSQHSSIGKVRFFFMTMRDHMSDWSPSASWPSLASKFYHIQRTRQTSLPPTTTFSNISITFLRGKFSTTKRPSKRGSWT